LLNKWVIQQVNNNIFKQQKLLNQQSYHLIGIVINISKKKALDKKMQLSLLDSMMVMLEINS